VNKHDDLYVGESGSVVELPAGSSTQVVLPFTGLSNVRGVALNKSGRDIFVADAGNDRVLELPITP
jgi:serine/threonine-protein kinase